MKRILATLSAVLLALTFVVPAQASVVHTITFYANASGSGEQTQRTTLVFDLRNTSAGLNAFAPSSACVKSGDGVYVTNWDNCISAIGLTLGVTQCMVLYDGYGYTGAAHAIHGPQYNNHYYNMSTVFNDRASSMRFGTISGGVCTAPWS